MRDAAEWMERYRVFWSGRLHALKRYVEQSRPTHAKERHP
jgi:hypothetical protein